MFDDEFVECLLTAAPDLIVAPSERPVPTFLELLCRGERTQAIAMHAFGRCSSPEALLERVDQNGCGVLHWALDQALPAVFVSALARAGFSFFRRDLHGMTPMHRLAASARFVECFDVQRKRRLSDLFFTAMACAERERERERERGRGNMGEGGRSETPLGAFAEVLLERVGAADGSAYAHLEGANVIHIAAAADNVLLLENVVRVFVREEAEPSPPREYPMAPPGPAAAPKREPFRGLPGTEPPGPSLARLWAALFVPTARNGKNVIHWAIDDTQGRALGLLLGLLPRFLAARTLLATDERGRAPMHIAAAAPPAHLDILCRAVTRYLGPAEPEAPPFVHWFARVCKELGATADAAPPPDALRTAFSQKTAECPRTPLQVALRSRHCALNVRILLRESRRAALVGTNVAVCLVLTALCAVMLRLLCTYERRFGSLLTQVAVGGAAAAGALLLAVARALPARSAAGRPALFAELSPTAVTLRAGALHSLTLGYLCPSCLAPRPLRSGHSALSGRCVLGLDQTRAVAAHDIGVGNQEPFAVGALLLCFALCCEASLVAWRLARAVLAEIHAFPLELRAVLRHTVRALLSLVGRAAPHLQCACVIAAPLIFFGYAAFDEFNSIFSGLTTLERKTASTLWYFQDAHGRFRNPWGAGDLANLLGFLSRRRRAALAAPPPFIPHDD